ncbi:MAG TPA: DUF6152 family protein [Gammaproteobacteria bacterium]|nr:DUF6152 family protein [Gammaproteobacteria bacterium]
MNARRFAAALSAAALAAAATTALAHHSRSNFDLDRTIEVRGVVTEFSWRNPHTYAVVESTNPDGTKDKWTFELNSTPVLKRFGWTPTTLAVGDHVVARGNPDRDPNRLFAYANTFTKDGREIVAWGGPQVKGPKLASQGSTDFSGVWRIRFEGDVLGRNTPDTKLVNTLPVNAKGQAQVDAFNPDDNPAWSCGPVTMPEVLGYPYPFQVVRSGGDRLVLRYEVDNLERVVHLDAATVPADAAPTPLGYSVGRFENGELIIDTARFSDVKWGNGRGVDSGAEKTTEERYRLGNDGKTLTLEFTMTDPEYLREPVKIEHTYDLLADYTLQDYTCDPATARRHLTAGEGGK